MRIELVTGQLAAGGGCVARDPDGRVVFVRHSLPGERVIAEVTEEHRSFARADAIEVLEASPDRVTPRCPVAGPGRCGGCDFQHIGLERQRSMKAALVAEQLRRVAGVDLDVVLEELPGAPTGLGWRGRVRFGVDPSGHLGLRRHRSHQLEIVESCPLASDEVEAVGAEHGSWHGASEVEVLAPAGSTEAVVRVIESRRKASRYPAVRSGLVVDNRILRPPGRVKVPVRGLDFRVSAGSFWQVHPGAAGRLVDLVLELLGPSAGDVVVDLYSGVGLYSAFLARAVGPTGSVVAVERDARAVADAKDNLSQWPWATVAERNISPGDVAELATNADLLVLDPAREGAGQAVMDVLVGAGDHLRTVVYVACDAASFARDLRVLLAAGWTMGSFTALDAFPMTEHVELVASLEPPRASSKAR